MSRFQVCMGDEVGWTVWDSRTGEIVARYFVSREAALSYAAGLA